MALDTSLSGINSNSYVSLAEADAYFITRVGANQWTDFDDELKEAYILTSMRQIELCMWAGVKKMLTQSLKWPRANCYNEDFEAITTIPKLLKEAVLELAYWQLTESDRMLSDTDITQIKKLSAGPLDVEVADKPQTFPTYVIQLLEGIGPGILISTPGKTRKNTTFTI